jgi:hypothetical protein
VGARASHFNIAAISVRPLSPSIGPNFDMDIRRASLKVGVSKILRWTSAAGRGKGARNCRA